jgi:drug/metabolite transporter (DMT)-like permease
LKILSAFAILYFVWGSTFLAIRVGVAEVPPFLLFWAEQRVPSGIAAVMMATIPVFMTLSEIAVLRTQRLTIRLALALLTGIAGVAVR